MRTTIAAACIAVAASGSVCCGDLTLEVTRAGEQANGFWDDAVFGETGLYDLWLYSDTPDVDLWAITVNIAGTPANHGSQWWISALGQADPDGLFGFFTNDGLIVDGAIIEASASAGFPGPFQPVAVPTGPANAILLYGGFEATNIEANGRLFAEAVFLDAGPGGQTVRSIGMVQTPAPGTLILLAGAGLAASRRRR